MSSPTTPDSTQLPGGPPPTDRDRTFLPDPLTDQLLRSLVTLTMELSVTRERLRSVEQVLDARGIDVAADIEALALSPDEDAARRAEREKLIDAVLGPIVKRLAQD